MIVFGCNISLLAFKMAQSMDRELKSVSLSTPLATVVNERTQNLGMTFADYVRYLLMEDTNFLNNKIPFISQEEEKALDRSKKDLKEGRVTSFKNLKELNQYYDKLLND